MSEVKTTATHGGKTYPIQGSCDPKFQKVLDQFIANFAEGSEDGACPGPGYDPAAGKHSFRGSSGA